MLSNQNGHALRNANPFLSLANTNLWSQLKHDLTPNIDALVVIHGGEATQH